MGYFKLIGRFESLDWQSLRGTLTIKAAKRSRRSVEEKKLENVRLLTFCVRLFFDVVRLK